jgi:hypothetical protein
VELESLEPPKLELTFEIGFELKFPFETRVYYGYSNALYQVLERTRRCGRKSEGNGPHVFIECARSACIAEGSSRAWNATKAKENQHEVP